MKTAKQLRVRADFLRSLAQQMVSDNLRVSYLKQAADLEELAVREEGAHAEASSKDSPTA